MQVLFSLFFLCFSRLVSHRILIASPSPSLFNLSLIWRRKKGLTWNNKILYDKYIVKYFIYYVLMTIKHEAFHSTQTLTLKKSCFFTLANIFTLITGSWVFTCPPGFTCIRNTTLLPSSKDTDKYKQTCLRTSNKVSLALIFTVHLPKCREILTSAAVKWKWHFAIFFDPFPGKNV